MRESRVKRAAREDLFVAEYLKDMNATAAMRRIGFPGTRPDVAASKMLDRPRVRAMIEKRAAAVVRRAEATQERIIDEACAIAYSDPRQYFDQHGALIPLRELPDHAAAAVSDLEFETVTFGEGEQQRSVTRVKKLKRWNKVEAIKLLAQIRGLTQPDRPAAVSIFNIQINL